jgi:ABC-type multidrug transport system ATPase subunit
MKTLCFHEYKTGRGPRVLLDTDTQRDGIRLVSGLNLVVAPNGYGKSTFLQTLGGLIRPIGGRASLEENGNVQPYQPSEHALLISEYLTFPKFIFPHEWIEFMAGQRSDPSRLEPHWEALRLTALRNQFLGRMSQGERRKVTWLAAHASNRPVILMDEPLDGLDLLAIDAARALLKSWEREGKIILLIAHQVSEVFDLSKQTLLFDSGRLKSWENVSGKTAEQVSTESFRKWTHDYYSRHATSN